MPYKVNIVVEKEEYGYYAHCLELDVGEVRGSSIEEVMSNIKEVLKSYLQDLSEEEIKEELLSKEIVITTIEVEAPNEKK